MEYTDTLISQYDDAAFQTAFRAYFGELGCRVTNWDGLFAGMGEKGRDSTWTRRDESGHVVNFVAWMNADEQDHTWVRKDESGAVVGFIQFTTMDMQSWFFTVKCGFIREFWIAPALRRQGHGTELLKMAEEWLISQGCAYAVLTTSTAPQFYQQHRYTRHREIQARNEEVVYVKALG